ncbi:MAG: T9SS type A sorting domain-containing protein, partial [Hyphomicrobiales bacterium]
NGDTTPEDTETFGVQLLGAVGAAVAKAAGTGTILNDDNVTGVETTLPVKFSFSVVGANPATDAVAFRIGLPTDASVEVTVFDIHGREVAEPVRGTLSPGYRTIRWSTRGGAGTTLASGIYFARCRMAGRTLHQRFIVMR